MIYLTMHNKFKRKMFHLKLKLKLIYEYTIFKLYILFKSYTKLVRILQIHLYIGKECIKTYGAFISTSCAIKTYTYMSTRYTSYCYLILATNSTQRRIYRFDDQVVRVISSYSYIYIYFHKYCKWISAYSTLIKCHSTLNTGSQMTTRDEQHFQFFFKTYFAKHSFRIYILLRRVHVSWGQHSDLITSPKN